MALPLLWEAGLIIEWNLVMSTPLGGGGDPEGLEYSPPVLRTGPLVEDIIRAHSELAG